MDWKVTMVEFYTKTYLLGCQNITEELYHFIRQTALINFYIYEKVNPNSNMILSNSKGSFEDQLKECHFPIMSPDPKYKLNCVL